MIANIIVGIYTARYLGPVNFGIINYATSIVALFLPFAGLGIQGILVREIVHYPDRENEFLGTAFLTRFVGGLVIFIAMALTMFFTEGDNETRMITIIIGFSIILQSFQTIELFFQAKVLAKDVAISQIIALLTTSVIKIYLVIFHYSLIYFAWVTFIETIIYTVGYIIFYIKTGNRFKSWNFNLNEAKKMVRESWPLILSGFVITVYMKIDQIIIKNMIGAEPLGNYSAALKISESYYFVPVIICSSLFPAIIKGKSISEREYSSRMQKLYILLTWFSFLFALGVSIFADQISYIVYKNRFSGVGPVLSLHIWAGLFVFWGTATGKWLVIEDRQIFDMFNTVMGAIINVGLNFLLIPHYGIYGSALATVIAYGFAGFLGYAFFRKTRTPFFMILRSFNILSAYKVFKNV